MKSKASPDTPRVSMILSGAISLGGYEAGVVSQIAYALAKWNEESEKPKAIMDVIAGASAGAMTGAMLARHVMTGSDAAEFVRLNYEQWAGVGFDTLFPAENLEKESGTQHSFLSSSVIDGPARALYNRLAETADPERVRQDELIYTCTLTSLDPIPFDFEYLTGNEHKEKDEMTGATRRDYITFSLQAGENPVVEVPSGCSRRAVQRDHITDWERVFNVAVASGAFPMAWQPMKIYRFCEDYLKPWSEDKGKCRALRYTDGGVLDNMPLDRASDALSAFEKEIAADEDRVYILIQPDPGIPEVVDDDKAIPSTSPERKDGRDDQTPLLGVLGEVYEALREQSFIMDVYNAQKVNRRLAARDQFFPRLMADATRGVPEAQVQERIAQVKTQLQEFLNQGHSHKTAEDFLLDYQQHATLVQNGTVVDETLKEAYESVVQDEARTTLFLLQLALSDCIAALHQKSEIRIERLFPRPADEDTPPEKLAGSILGHFGGFLSRERMHYDFMRGMQDAQSWLKEWGKRKQWDTPAYALDEVKLDGMGAEWMTPEVEKRALLPWKDVDAATKDHFTDKVLKRGEIFIGDEMKAGIVGRVTLDIAERALDSFIKHKNNEDS